MTKRVILNKFCSINNNNEFTITKGYYENVISLDSCKSKFWPAVHRSNDSHTERYFRTNA